MRRRFFSAILALTLIFACLPVSVFADEFDVFKAESPKFTGTLSISENAIEMIKGLEGYVDRPFSDYTQQSIGYGCSTEFAKKYGFDPEHLTKEEAHELMLFVLDEMETHVDHFLRTYGVSVNQYQYDALVSLTYNLGRTWMSPNSRIGKLLVSGDYTVNEMASAFGIYTHVGYGANAKVDSNLVSRRILETKLFLFGAYKLSDVPQKFCRMTYAGNVPPDYTDVALYQEGEPYQVLFEPDPTDHEGEYFAGWYTENGQKLTAFDVAMDNETVHAEWSATPVDAELEGPRVRYYPADNPPVVERDYSNGSQETKPQDKPEPQPQPEYKEASTVFSDLNSNQWHYSYVNDLFNAGIIDGYDDGKFRPDRSVSCGETLKMILLAAGYPEPTQTSEHWASGYYDMAVQHGIIDETDFKSTQLDVEISRKTMAKIAANALGLTDYPMFPVYTDTDNVYAAILYYYEITEGYEDNTFRPDRALTRAELSAIVWRINHNF